MPFKSPKDTVGADRCCRLCQGKPDVWLVTNLGVFGRVLAGAFIVFGGLLAIVVGDGLPLPQKIPLTKYGVSGFQLWL